MLGERVMRTRLVNRWVSCSQESDWFTSRYSHFLLDNGIDTGCGASGMGEGVWRVSKSKPKCKTCWEWMKKNLYEAIEQPVLSIEREPAKIVNLDKVKYTFAGRMDRRGIESYIWKTEDKNEEPVTAGVEWYWGTSKKGEGE